MNFRWLPLTIVKIFCFDINITYYFQETDVALLKLYAELNTEGLIPLISNDSGCDLNDCVEWLEKYKRFHALGLLYRLHSDHDKALGIWQK